MRYNILKVKMDNRFYFEKLENDFAVFDVQESQHIFKVRRCKVGDEITAFNGDGYDYHLKIESLGNRVTASVIDKQPNRANNDVKVVVYLAMLKNDALATAIDHLVELNVSEVKLFKSDFSIAVVDEKKLAKLQATVIQACKQSERAKLMKISIIDKKKIITDISTKNCFFAYEDSTSKIQKFTGDFSIIIGPEGGFSPAENEYFSSFANNISLGKTILRAEVACVASVSMLKVVHNEG